MTGGGTDPGLIEKLDDFLVQLDSLRERRLIVFGSAAALLMVVLGLWWFGSSDDHEAVDDRIPRVSLEPIPRSTVGPASLLVHVAGAVARPGVYELAGDDRVLDAIGEAGGALPDADLDQLNLAAPLSDGVQIRVPAEGEILPTSSPANSVTGPVDLNRASAIELETLPGVGPSTAAAIASWRDEHGPFVVVDDLLAVPGIGPAKLSAIIDLVVVR